MVATTRARGETRGRMKRDRPMAPTGIQPSSSTFWAVPMAPNRTVPVRPASPKAGDDGAVEPRPADCQPETKWCQVVPQLGNAASWPTRGSGPKKSSRVPSATTSAATT